MSDAVARPGMFNVRARYSKVHCDEPEYEDLWAEIRTNLRHDERAEFIERLEQLNQDVRGFVAEMVDTLQAAEKRLETATDDDERHTARLDVRAAQSAIFSSTNPEMIANRNARWELIAPYIRAWNVCDDDYHDVPPPAVGGIDSFQYTDFVSSAWLVNQIEQGYRGGKGVGTSSKRSDDTPVPMSGPQIVSAEAA